MVKNILGMLAGGYTIDKILTLYPEIKRKDIISAIDYVTQVIDEEKVILRNTSA